MRVPPAVARRNNKQLWSVVYIPQVGFVISVTGGKLSEELCELLPDYSLAFMGEDGPAGLAGAAAAAAAAAEDSSGVDLDRSCAYYTCNVTQQLNASYGDLQHKIQDLEVGRHETLGMHSVVVGRVRLVQLLSRPAGFVQSLKLVM